VPKGTLFSKISGEKLWIFYLDQNAVILKESRCSIRARLNTQIIASITLRDVHTLAHIVMPLKCGEDIVKVELMNNGRTQELFRMLWICLSRKFPRGSIR